MSDMRRKYHVIRDVVKASGTQTFTAYAYSHEEAARIVNDGGGTFDNEELEIMDLSDACEVICDDDQSSKRVTP